MKGVVQVFDLEEQFWEYTTPKIDCLVFPREFRSEIKILTSQNNETGGAIIYKTLKQNSLDFYVVEYLKVLNTPQSPYWTGRFNETIIDDFMDKIVKVRDYKPENGSINLIWFHCHTKETGEYWYDKFSAGDFNAFEHEKDNYQHILLTPTNALTYRKEALDFRFTQNYSSHQKERKEFWDKIFGE